MTGENLRADQAVEIAVRMSDGVSIAVHLYPGASSPAPAVLLIVPYRKESVGIGMLASLVQEAGYNLLAADVRGFGGSDAPYEGLLSGREIDDGVELIDWIARQPFCDGQVAMIGGSYFGANQVLIAARRPPALRCIAPFTNFVDTYRDMTHRGGIPSHAQWGAMVYLRSQHAETARRGLEHYYLDLMLDPFDNAGHRSRSPETVLSQVTVPALCLGGWHDYFLRGTVRTYLGLGGPKRLVIGPWGHAGFGPHHQQELIAWLNYWLRDQGLDPTVGKRVQLRLTGADDWREHEDWPDPASRRWTSLHPHPDGLLHPVPADEPTQLRVLAHLAVIPQATNPKPELMPDPTDSGMAVWGEDTVFDSPPLDDEMIVEGPVCLIARLRATDCNDLDLYARISVLTADGGCQQVAEGRLRASHRTVDLQRSALSPDGDPVMPWHPHDSAEPLVPDQGAELVIEIGPVCHRFAPGERIRLGITLARADEAATTASARLEPGTRLLVPLPGV